MEGQPVQSQYEQVVQLLGNERKVSLSPEGETTARYSLLAGTCGNAWFGFQIVFEKQKVRGWRWAHAMEGNGKFEWFSDNMVYDPEKNPLDAALIRKQPSG